MKELNSPAMTPDVYSGIVFSHLTEEYLYSNEPLAINGASIHSGGTAAFEKKKIKRNYDPAEKFWKEPNIPFHEDLPLMHSGRPVRSIPVIVYEAYLQAKAFHDLKLISISKSSQLATTLAKSGPDPSEIMEWAGLFCAKHNVEMPNQLLIRFRSLKDRLSRLLFRLKRGAYSNRVIGSIRVPLQNVFEASLVAGFVKDAQPSLLQRIRNRIKRMEK